MHPIYIDFLPVHSNEKIYPSLKKGRKKSLVVMMSGRRQTQKD